MQNKSLLAAFAVAFIAAHVASAEPWRDLFDGNTLDGWKQRGSKTLYITARTGLYAIDLNVAGAW